LIFKKSSFLSVFSFFSLHRCGVRGSSMVRFARGLLNGLVSNIAD